VAFRMHQVRLHHLPRKKKNISGTVSNKNSEMSSGLSKHNGKKKRTCWKLVDLAMKAIVMTVVCFVAYALLREMREKSKMRKSILSLVDVLDSIARMRLRQMRREDRTCGYEDGMCAVDDFFG